jgi:hypothetical protein
MHFSWPNPSDVDMGSSKITKVLWNVAAKLPKMEQKAWLMKA